MFNPLAESEMMWIRTPCSHQIQKHPKTIHRNLRLIALTNSRCCGESESAPAYQVAVFSLRSADFGRKKSEHFLPISSYLSTLSGRKTSGILEVSFKKQLNKVLHLKH